MDIKTSCLVDKSGNFQVTLDSCEKEDFEEAINQIITETNSANPGACLNFESEMRLLFQDRHINPREAVTDMCIESTEAAPPPNRRATAVSFRDFFQQLAFQPQDDAEEFFNGGTFLNTEYDGPNGSGDLSVNAAVIQSFYDSTVTTTVLTFPDGEQEEDYFVEGLQDCSSNSVICCYVADRQNDGFGTCRDNVDCKDEEPVDNTDVCYVRYRETAFAAHVAGGVSLFPSNIEGPVHCEGFVWASDENDASYRFRGNLLFHLALKKNLYDQGYVRPVPGAPLCGCSAKMPVISEADCVEVVVDELYNFVFSPDQDTVVDNQGFTKISFKECSGGSLLSKVDELLADGKISSASANRFRDNVVGDCETAINNLRST